ncbi:hypothetical protein PISMIDRAFT_683927, partial [Pisolithus microcarpus 441]
MTIRFDIPSSDPLAYEVQVRYCNYPADSTEVDHDGGHAACACSGYERHSFNEEKSTRNSTYLPNLRLLLGCCC